MSNPAGLRRVAELILHSRADIFVSRGLFHAGTLVKIECECYERMMEKHFLVNKGLGLTTANTKEEFYGFHVNQIWKVHSHKQGFGGGLFYRLISGFVYDATGRRHESDEVLYDQTTH